jgi:hypothetical protein
MDIKKTANKISSLIVLTDTEQRGDLLFMVGALLVKDAQNFTGRIFLRSGEEHGVSEEFEEKILNGNF